MNKFFDLQKTSQVLFCAALLGLVILALPSVDRWHGGAGIALYFVALLLGLMTLGFIFAPSRHRSKSELTNLIERYSYCLKKSDHLFRDIRELPASKEDIGEAILLFLAENKGDVAESSLKFGFVELSKFQFLTAKQKRAVGIYSAGADSPLSKMMSEARIASEIMAEVLTLIELESAERMMREARLAEFEHTAQSRPIAPK